jgi:twitching motility two-component system response regulator PilH
MPREQILIVDNSADNLKLAQLLLGCQGYAVRTAEDAEQALSLLGNCRPELIRMDSSFQGSMAWNSRGGSGPGRN